jgi:hypothetical protein
MRIQAKTNLTLLLEPTCIDLRLCQIYDADYTVVNKIFGKKIVWLVYNMVIRWKSYTIFPSTIHMFSALRVTQGLPFYLSLYGMLYMLIYSEDCDLKQKICVV